MEAISIRVGTSKRSVGHPPAPWTDDIKRVEGSGWVRKAEGMVLLHSLGKSNSERPQA